MADEPLISIVITSYTLDRLDDIFELLDSIKAQTYANIETIFVSERSRELYDQIEVYTQQKGIPNPKIIFNDGEPGLSAARNLGIKEAKGNIIAFVDDDVLLFPNWVEEMVKTQKDDSTIGVTGPAYPLWDDESAASWFPEEFCWIMSCTAWSDWSQIREVRNVWGQGMAFKREAFEKCGLFLNEFGFHKGPMAEDNEFSLRARNQTGKRIMYSPTVKLWHRVHKYRLSWKFIKERAYWIGYSRHMLKKLYPQAEGNKTDLLSQEHQLLKRIFTRLFPNILKTFFTHPLTAWRKSQVSITVLFFVALGYYSHLLPNLRGKTNNLAYSDSAAKHNS